MCRQNRVFLDLDNRLFHDFKPALQVKTRGFGFRKHVLTYGCAKNDRGKKGEEERCIALHNPIAR